MKRSEKTRILKTFVWAEQEFVCHLEIILDPTREYEYENLKTGGVYKISKIVKLDTMNGVFEAKVVSAEEIITVRYDRIIGLDIKYANND